MLATRRSWRLIRRSGLRRQPWRGSIAAFAAMSEFRSPEFAGRIRRPDPDDRGGDDTIVVGACHWTFAGKLRDGIASHDRGCEAPKFCRKTTRYRERLWAAFDAFVPG